MNVVRRPTDGALYAISICSVGLVALFSLGMDLWLAALFLAGLFLLGSMILFAWNKPFIWVIATVCIALLGPVGRLMPSNTQVPLTLFQVTLLITLFVFVLYKINSGRLELRFSSHFLWMAAFSTLLFVSGIYSVNRADTLLIAATLIPLLIFVLVIADVFDQTDYFKWLFESAVCITSIPAALSVYVFIKDPSLSLYNMLSGASGAYWVMERQAGSVGGPNQFGMLLVFPLLYLVVRLFIYPRIGPGRVAWTTYHGAMLVLLFGALLTTYSRSAWLTMAFGTLAVFLISKKFLRFILLASISVGIAAICSHRSAFLQSLLSRIVSMMDLSPSATAASISNTSRILLAQAGLEMFRDSYFMGFGYRSFAALAPQYVDLTKTFNVVSPHNLSIQLLAELGLVGFVVFYGMVLSVFREGLRLLSRVDADTRLYLVTVLGYVVCLMVFYQLGPQGIKDNLLWFCFGAILAIRGRLSLR